MPLFAVWNRKIDLIEGHRVSVICNDGRVYEGFGAVPCIGEDENGEETDAVRLDLRQYRTKIVRQMRRQIFRQMKQKAE